MEAVKAKVGDGETSRKKSKETEANSGLDGWVRLTWDGLSKREKDGFLSSLYGSDSLVNIEAEQALIGALLISNEAFFSIEKLNPEDFFETVHQKIFSDLREMITKKKAANPITLKTKYDSDRQFESIGISGSEYLIQCAGSAGNVIDAKHYAGIIFDLSCRRKMIALLWRHIAEFSSKDNLSRPISELKAGLINDTMDAPDDKKEKRISTWAQVLDTLIEDVEADIQPDRTGIAGIDDALSGGFFRRKLYDFNARMKKGKTLLMTTIYTNMVHDFHKQHADNLELYKHGHLLAPPEPKRLLYICAEMGQTEIHQRIVARQMGLSSTVFFNRDSRQTLINGLGGVRSKVSAMPGLFYDARGLRMDELQYVLTVAVNKMNIGGFFLDYFSLVRPEHGTKHENKVDFYEHLADWLCAFVKENDIWCCTANQINRLGQIRGGDALLMYADVIMELDRDEGNQGAWLTNNAIRYYYRRNVGTKESPGLFMKTEGPHFVDYDERESIPKRFEFPANVEMDW